VRRRPILAAVALGFALRAGFGLIYWVGKPLTHDEREYLSLARSLASGRGFTYDAAGLEDNKEQFGRAPGYPAFLALVGGGSHVTTDTPTPVKLAQAAVGAAGVWLVALIAARAAGERGARTAAWLAAVYPPLVWICAYALSEAVYSTLALASALLLDSALDRERRNRPSAGLALATGLVAGVATLTRPAMLFFLLMAGLWLLSRQRWRVLAAVALGSLLVVAPWTWRNLREYGRFVLVATEGGVTFWTGNHPRAIGEGDLAANLDLKRESLALKEQHSNLTSAELEPIYYREAFRFIASHPLSWAALVARKFLYLWVPIGPSYRLHSTLYYAASLVSYGLVLPFAVAGAWRLRQAPAERQPLGLWLLAGSAVLVSLAFFPAERFRIPVIDPALIICASAWYAARRQP
jgi:4-amino-4-deoxy-L-arabinose transferase-like glycosyltransferase